VDFLYCISKYPAPLPEIKLSAVDFQKYSGFSDHSVGTAAACASFVLGSRILEKHLTMDKSAYGPDHACSMTPDELALIDQFRRDWAQCG
jgi:sialic acid synthase SpsE